VNHTRLLVRQSPARLSTSRQQSYKGWSCRIQIAHFKSVNLIQLNSMRRRELNLKPITFWHGSDIWIAARTLKQWV